MDRNEFAVGKGHGYLPLGDCVLNLEGEHVTYFETDKVKQVAGIEATGERFACIFNRDAFFGVADI